MSDTIPQIIAPRLAGAGLRLDLIDKLLADDAAATAKTLGTPYAAVIIAMIAALANRAASFDKRAAADFFHAIWQKLANGEQSAELDTARVNRAAVTLFHAGWRRAKA